MAGEQFRDQYFLDLLLVQPTTQQLFGTTLLILSGLFKVEVWGHVSACSVYAIALYGGCRGVYGSLDIESSLYL